MEVISLEPIHVCPVGIEGLVGLLGCEEQQKSIHIWDTHTSHCGMHVHMLNRKWKSTELGSSYLHSLQTLRRQVLLSADDKSVAQKYLTYFIRRLNGTLQRSDRARCSTIAGGLDALWIEILGLGLVTPRSVNWHQACLRSSHSELLFVPSFHLVSPIDKESAST